MTVTAGRHTARFEGPLTLFIIGMRVNRPLLVHKWLPVFKTMGPMLTELYQNPDSGFLRHDMCWKSPLMPVLIQYWRDFDSLERYARDREASHWPAWLAFNKAIGNDGTVGIFHETYCVPAGAHETIYGNMTPFGLGAINGTVLATGSRNEARQRMRAAGEG